MPPCSLSSTIAGKTPLIVSLCDISTLQGSKCNKEFASSLVVGTSMTVSVSGLLAASPSTKLEAPKRHSVVSILLFEGEVNEESLKSRTVCIQS